MSLFTKITFTLTINTIKCLYRVNEMCVSLPISSTINYIDSNESFLYIATVRLFFLFLFSKQKEDENCT